MVRWTERARTDLRAIHDFITRDSGRDAQAAVGEILMRADSLASAPRVGRIVAELGESDLREIPAQSWRILYRVRDGQVYIVTLVHRRRHLDPADLAG